MWQDYVVSIAQIMLVIGIVPIVFSDEKPPLSSSSTTSTALLIMGFSFMTLGLVLSTIFTLVCAVLWVTLFVQKVTKYK
mgnify:CR=1 FL=1